MNPGGRDFGGYPVLFCNQRADGAAMPAGALDGRPLLGGWGSSRSLMPFCSTGSKALVARKCWLELPRSPKLLRLMYLRRHRFRRPAAQRQRRLRLRPQCRNGDAHEPVHSRLRLKRSRR